MRPAADLEVMVAGSRAADDTRGDQGQNTAANDSTANPTHSRKWAIPLWSRLLGWAGTGRQELTCMDLAAPQELDEVGTLLAEGEGGSR
jgi:hypothetical protein